MSSILESKLPASEAVNRPGRSGWLLRWLRDVFTRGTRQRALKSLSARQLRDAGIDPVLAGRGKAAAARLDPNQMDQR